MNVTMRQLRAFLAVLEERSFTQAAARLHLTQSALTVAVKSLEREVGLRLLDRTTRAVTPTLYGERLAGDAMRLLEGLDRALDDLRADAARERGAVAVAATATVIGHILVPALKALSQQYPGISVRLIEALTDEASRLLLAGDVDFAITTLPVPDPALDAIEFLRDRFELVCRADHALGTSPRALKWQALAKYDRVGLSRGSGVHALLSRHGDGEVGVRGLRYEASSVAGLTRMVEAGLGVAAVPALIAREMIAAGVSATLISRPLTPAIHRRVFLARRPGRAPTPAADAVVAETVRRLQVVSDRQIEATVDRDALGRIGFDIAQ